LLSGKNLNSDADSQASNYCWYDHFTYCGNTYEK